MTFRTQDEFEAAVDKLFLSMIGNLGHLLRKGDVWDYVKYIAKFQSDLNVDALIDWGIEDGIIRP